MSLMTRLKQEASFHLRDLRHNPKIILGMPRRLWGFLRGADHLVKGFYEKCELLNDEKSFEVLMREPVKSFVRIGDGEMQILMGSSVFFGDWQQLHDPVLQGRMREIFKRDDLHVGLVNEQLLASDEEMKRRGDFVIWSQMRSELWRFLKKGGTFLSAFVFRENPDLDVKRMWDFLGKRVVVIVTGDESAFSVMEGALPKVQFVRTPGKNAWGKYEEILGDVKGVIEEKNLKNDNTIFLVSLGPTAKPLVLDITDLGFLAWDTGHFFRKFGEKILELKNGK